MPLAPASLPHDVALPGASGRVARPSALRAVDVAADAALALGVAANLALVWSARFLPCMDVPNHAGSVHVMARLLAGDPFYARHWRIARELVPDLLAELLGLTLLRGLDPLVAARVTVSLYVLAMPLGYRALAARLNPGAVALLPLGAVITMGLWYTMGGVNYLLGVAALPWACLALVRATESRGRLALALALAALTWLAHVYAYCCLLAFAALLALTRVVAWRAARAPAPARADVARAVVALVALAGGFLYAVRAVLVGGQEWVTRAPPTWQLGPARVAGLLRATFWYRGGATPWVVGALALLVVAGAALAWRRGGRRALADAVCAPLALTGLALLVVAWASPINLGGETGIGSRFAAPGVMFLAAGLRPPPAAWLRALAVGVVAFAFGVKWGDERAVHARFDADARRLEAALTARIPRHAAVLPAYHFRAQGGYEDLFVHYWDWAVVQREAHVPDLFAVPGQQVLRHAGVARSERARVAQLIDADLAGFDHVWVASDDVPAVVAPVASRLRLVASSGAHSLFAVTRAAAPRATGGITHVEPAGRRARALGGAPPR